jgi:hypothetical protein
MCDWAKFPANITDLNDLKTAYTTLRAFVMDSIGKHRVCGFFIISIVCLVVDRLYSGRVRKTSTGDSIQRRRLSGSESVSNILYCRRPLNDIQPCPMS